MGATNPTRFQLVFPRIPHLEMFCNVIILPNVNMEVAPQNTPYLDMRTTGEKLKFGQLETTFLFDAEMKNYKYLFDWMKNISTQNLHKEDAIDARLITTTGVFVFVNVFPVSLGTAIFDSTKTDIEYPTCQAIFAYDHFFIE